MKERPILFSAPMVQAILDGHKTQTRRVIKPKLLPLVDEVLHANGKWVFDTLGYELTTPYGRPDDRLWVRESWAVAGIYSDVTEVRYRASENRAYSEFVEQFPNHCAGYPAVKATWPKYKPSIHMPRWASRIELEITNVRVERLDDISEADAIAEGVADCDPAKGLIFADHRTAFVHLWNQINSKKHPWESNPWVWVVEFRQVQP